MFCRSGSKSDGSEVTEVTPPGNTATFTRVAVLLLLTTTYLGRGYDDARVTPPHRHVRIGTWSGNDPELSPRIESCHNATVPIIMVSNGPSVDRSLLDVQARPTNASN